MKPPKADSYAEQVDIIKQGFEFVLCDLCDGDLDDHEIAPDPLGNAHAYCKGNQED